VPTPQIQTWETPRGVRVYFVETAQLPMLDIQVVFDAGTVRDPAGKRGVALLANSLMDQSAGGLDADRISFEFERLGAEFGSQSGYDSASVSLRSLSDPTKLQPALDNLHTVLTRPDYQTEDLERQRNQLLVGIQGKQQSPGDIADEKFMEAIYQGHPYGYPTEGDATTLAAITRDDLVSFHQTFYTASNAMVTIVGDTDRAGAEAIAESITRDLPEGTRPGPAAAVVPLSAGNTISLSHPSSQVHIVTGQTGMRYGDPDYFALYVGNHILGGGGLVSRLFEEVREKRGLSYGASSYFAPRRDAGPFMASISTRGDQAAEGLAVLKKTIADFIEQGPTEDELVAVKKNITGGFPLRIDSNKKISGYLSVIGFYGLPLDYLDRFNERIEAVNVDQIRDAFQRRVDPDKFVTVLVGPVDQSAASPAN
jgi:zinc protease